MSKSVLGLVTVSFGYFNHFQFTGLEKGVKIVTGSNIQGRRFVNEVVLEVQMTYCNLALL